MYRHAEDQAAGGSARADHQVPTRDRSVVDSALSLFLNA
jgi:hypothetical protein